LKDKNFFQVIYEISKESPWKAAAMIRFIYTTPCYKNYISGVIDINFFQFVSIGSFHLILVFIFDFHIGQSLKSLDEIDNYNIFDDYLLTVSAIFYFITAMYTIFVLCFLGKKTIDKHNEEKEEADDKVSELCDEENATYQDKDQSMETATTEIK
jgi:hypothetical protein